MSSRASRSRASVAPAAAVRAPASSKKKRASTAASPAKRGRARAASPAAAAARVPSKSPAKKRSARSARSPAGSAKKKKPASAKKSSKKKRASKSPAKRARSPSAAEVAPDVQSPAKKAKVVRKSVSKARRVSKSPAARKTSKSPAARGRARQASRSRSAVRRGSASPAARSRSRSRTGRQRSRSSSPIMAAAAAVVKKGAKKAVVAARKSVASAAASVQEATQSAVQAIQAAQAHAHAAAASAPKRESAVPEENESEGQDSDNDDSSPEPEIRAADRTPPRAPRFSEKPQDGGLSFMPRVSSYPSTPKAAGVSTILTALNNVAVPPAVFMSPFPADRKQQRRRSYGGSKPNEGEEEASNNGAEEDEEESSDSVAGFSNPFSSSTANRKSGGGGGVKKTLRPSQAEVRKASGTQSGKVGQASRQQGDTPTISRARSRLQASDDEGDNVARKIGESDDESNGDHATSSSTSSSRTSRRVLGDRVEETHHSETSTSSSKKRTSSTSASSSVEDGLKLQRGSGRRGGLVSTHDSTVPWTAAGILLLSLAQFLALNASFPGDRLGLSGVLHAVQAWLNKLFAEYAAPLLGRFITVSTAPLTVSWLTTPTDWVWLIVPTLYILAAVVVKHGYALTGRDRKALSSAAADASSRANARHAHHVFVSSLAFVSAIAFWVVYTASQVHVPAAAKTAGAQVGHDAHHQQPLFSSSWYSAFLVLTTFSWAMTEVTVFTRNFSTAHLALWIPVLLVSEAAYWKMFPTNLFVFFPASVRQFHALFLSFYPSLFNHALTTSAVTIPLVVVQVAEMLKGLSGVCYSVIGKLLIFLVPAAYLYGEKHIFELLSNVTGAAWLEAMLALAVVGAISGWEIMKHIGELQVRRAE